MAHVIKLGALTDELVTLITSTSSKSDRAKFNVYRESALRGLRSQIHHRTNQFEVASDLDGLEEKFRVYNEDPLADALRERLDTLDRLEVKLAPEILHLLLQLSDKPVFKSRIENLDLLKEPEPDAGPPLKWEDLIAEDPSLGDKKLWRTIDYTAESSDDEDAYEVRSELSDETDTTIPSSMGEDQQRRPEDHAINTISREQLQALRDVQFWQKTPKVNGIILDTVKIPITEMQAIREVLFMLGGVKTSLFESQIDRPLFVNFSKKYTLTHLSLDMFSKLMDSFAKQGSRLRRLRSWIKRVEPIPLLQVLQSSIQERLGSFDLLLSAIQTRFVAVQEDVTVSLLGLRNELSSSIQSLLRMSEVIERLVSERYGHAFRYLEMLFDETCVSQMVGDTEMYEFMGRVFFQCFRVYLRPIRTWMEDGELTPGDKVFFVAEASGHNETTSLWKSRFKIRRTQDGVLHAPKFLSAAANKIFTAGKSVVILKHLNQFELFKAGATTIEPTLDFGTVCNPDTLGIAPFPELFDTAFDEWIQSKHHHASYLLRRTLFDACGLRFSLEALSQLYFLSDGIITTAFTNSVFDKLDTLNSSWNDRFTLTELVQSTFGKLPAISPDRIQVNVLSLSPKQKDVATCRRTVKALAIMELRYSLSWPIQIVLSPLTLSSYRRVFTFLIQIRRSSHILSRRRLVLDDQSDTSSSDERALYYSLRARLLWFNDMLYYYLTTLVLEPRSQKMREDLNDAEDVDSMIEIHSSFIKAVIDQTLLGSRLELIHKTLLKILDLGIKLEDAQAANALASKEAMEHQQELMDLSMQSLGLATPKRKKVQSHSFRKSFREGRHGRDSGSDEDEDEEIDVDLSILSIADEDKGDIMYIDKLRKMKTDFDRLVKFVANGLRGVARAGGGEGSKSWDTLGEMLESGLSHGSSNYR